MPRRRADPVSPLGTVSHGSLAKAVSNTMAVGFLAAHSLAESGARYRRFFSPRISRGPCAHARYHRDRVSYRLCRPANCCTRRDSADRLSGCAVSTNLRVNAGVFPVVFPILLGLLLWGALFLRDSTLRTLIPLRS